MKGFKGIILHVYGKYGLVLDSSYARCYETTANNNSYYSQEKDRKS